MQKIFNSNFDFHKHSIAERDAHWMQQALSLAKKAQASGEVPIGAVLVIGKELLGEGWNQPIATFDPTAHAEIVAIRNAAHKLGNYRLPADTTLYVTLEPCAMCTGALLNARLTRLVYGARDAKAGAVASVFSLLDQRRLNHTIAWEGGCLAESCVALLQEFFRQRR